eukprot:Skav215074  [mRNA]  locus=scaffold2575:69897:78545:- [translate_table: standard]
MFHGHTSLPDGNRINPEQPQGKAWKVAPKPLAQKRPKGGSFHGAVAGATGRVGQALTRQLLLSPLCQEVHAVTRQKISAYDELAASAKLKQHFADFGSDLCGLNQSSLQGVDAAFCVLGARSSDPSDLAKERDAVLRFVRLCQEAGVPHLTLLSSVWAKPSSMFPFARVQGETIEAVAAMKTFPRTSIFQPSAVTGTCSDGTA